MGYQYVIDNAQTLSMNRVAIVASTQARDGTVRQINRGANYWKIEVTMAPARWQDVRQDISKIEYTRSSAMTDTLTLSSSNYSWLSQYQGNVNLASIGGFYASWTKGNTYLTLTTSPTLGSGYKFRAGDLIQLGASRKVYAVAADVAYNSNTVQLHRPIIDDTQTNINLLVGQNVTWTVRCSQFPKWTLTERNIVAWEGSFVFVEAL